MSRDTKFRVSSNGALRHNENGTQVEYPKVKRPSSRALRQILWNICSSLCSKCKTNVTPPENMTDDPPGASFSLLLKRKIYTCSQTRIRTKIFSTEKYRDSLLTNGIWKFNVPQGLLLLGLKTNYYIICLIFRNIITSSYGSSRE